MEKGEDCRQATKRRILIALSVPWDERYDYFPRMQSVKPPVADRVAERESA